MRLLLEKMERIQRLEADDEASLGIISQYITPSGPADFHLKSTKKVAINNAEYYLVRSWARELQIWENNNRDSKVSYYRKEKNVLLVPNSYDNAELLIPALYDRN